VFCGVSADGGTEADGSAGLGSTVKVNGASAAEVGAGVDASETEADGAAVAEGLFCGGAVDDGDVAVATGTQGTDVETTGVVVVGVVVAVAVVVAVVVGVHD